MSHEMSYKAWKRKEKTMKEKERKQEHWRRKGCNSDQVDNNSDDSDRNLSQLVLQDYPKGMLVWVWHIV